MTHVETVWFIGSDLAFPHISLLPHCIRLPVYLRLDPSICITPHFCLFLALEYINTLDAFFLISLTRARSRHVIRASRRIRQSCSGSVANDLRPAIVKYVRSPKGQINYLNKIQIKLFGSYDEHSWELYSFFRSSLNFYFTGDLNGNEV